MPDRPDAGPETAPDPAPHHQDGSGAWAAAARRGAAPIVLGLVSLAVSVPATEDLDPLLRWVGVILLVLGLVIVVATARTLSAGE